MILGALDIYYKRLSGQVTLKTGMLCQLIYLLLGDYDCILVVKAREIGVLQGIVAFIDLVEYLPCHIELDTLSHHFQLVAILVLEVGAPLEIQRVVLVGELLVESRLPFLHQLVEDQVVLVADALVGVPVLLGYSKLTGILHLRARHKATLRLLKVNSTVEAAVALLVGRTGRLEGRGLLLPR